MLEAGTKPAFYKKASEIFLRHEPTYRITQPFPRPSFRQCFVQFRCRLVSEKLIDQEALFIDGTKIEANANNFTFVWKKSIEKFQQGLIEKSNQLYNELLEKEIIPEIEQENEEHYR